MSRKSRYHKALRRLKYTAPMGTGIFLLIAGIMLGTVFTFGMQYWHSPVTQEEAVKITAAYDHCKAIYGHRRPNRNKLQDIMLYFSDHEGYLSVDNALTSTEVLNALQAIPAGTVLDMLTHPHSRKTILSLRAAGEEIIAFEDASARLAREAKGFLIFGICIYLLALYGGWSVLVRWQYRRIR